MRFEQADETVDIWPAWHGIEGGGWVGGWEDGWVVGGNADVGLLGMGERGCLCAWMGRGNEAQGLSERVGAWVTMNAEWVCRAWKRGCWLCVDGMRWGGWMSALMQGSLPTYLPRFAAAPVLG